jgi:hypothetical protein
MSVERNYRPHPSPLHERPGRNEPIPRTTVAKTKLCDNKGNHVATRIDTDTIVDRRDGKQYQVTPLRTSQVPRQPRVLTVEQAKQLVNAALTQDVPQPPSVLSEVVKIQQARGQR